MTTNLVLKFLPDINDQMHFTSIYFISILLLAHFSLSSFKHRNNSDGLDLAKSFVGVHLPEGNTTTMGNDSAANDTTTEAAQMGEVEQSEEITNFKNWLMDKSFKLSATFFTGNGLYVEYPHFGLEGALK